MITHRTSDSESPFNAATLSAATVAAAIFVLDISTPPTLDPTALYLVPLLVGTMQGPPRFPLLAAGVASALIIAGPWVAGDQGRPEAITPTRSVALVAVWSAAMLMARFRATWLDLQARTKDVADLEFAINQSAIVATTNTKGIITAVNQKFCDISQYSRDDLIGHDHRIINSGYHSKAFIRDLWRTIARGQIWRGEIRNRAKDGSFYWVDTTIVPFLDQRGKPYQYMAIRYDITDRKRSEARLREQGALARLGQMAAVVAHEVKNPIAGIRGALQVIGGRLPAASSDRAVMGEIIARLDGLNAIVQDLLVFARPRAPRFAAVDLRALLQTTLDVLQADPLFARIEVNMSGEAIAVSADAEQLRLVFTNVLVNAAQAMGGIGAINIGLSATRDGCVISFADAGPGMTAEVRARIFEPFFTTKSRGTGLGLPTARSIVEAHGGTIATAAGVERGTVVSISLPHTPPPSAGYPDAD